MEQELVELRAALQTLAGSNVETNALLRTIRDRKTATHWDTATKVITAVLIALLIGVAGSYIKMRDDMRDLRSWQAAVISDRFTRLDGANMESRLRQEINALELSLRGGR